MLSYLKVLYRRTNKKAIRTILLIVVLPIIALRLLGILQWMEWAAYDLLFHLSPDEPKEERIVLVTWDEQDLQRSKHLTLSDQELVSVLEKIKAQKPRVIGLDLYRDIPYLSNRLEKKENEQAYNELQSIFRSTPNLIGIEKVLEPKIAPPPTLKEKNQVFSSDLITDTDNIVRRSYIDPQPLEEEGNLDSYRNVPYVGMILATDYLAESGFSVDSFEDGSLRLFKDQSEIVVDNLKTFDGGYINNLYNLDFLVNWRRGNNLFETVSVGKLLEGEIPTELFRDKIVLIGNTASSTADRHFLPIKRWEKNNETWSYGLYLVAHVTSSIISAALDGRPLIRVAPIGSGYILLAISVISLASGIFRFSHLPTKKLYFLSALFSLVLTILLSLGSLLGFQFGWWIPVVPAILGIWLTFITANNQVQTNKERKNTLKLELICLYLDHKLGNSTNLIKLSAKGIQKFSTSVYNNLAGDFQDAQLEGYYDVSERFDQTNNGQSLTSIKARLRDINAQIDSITKYRHRTTKFIDVTLLRKQTPQTASDVNHLVKQVIQQTLAESEYKYEILVEEIYDNSLPGQKIDRLVVEIVLENLLDNAFYAVNPKSNQDANYLPKVVVETKSRKNSLEISVQDNGSGIPQIKQPEIFKPFVSFKADRGQGIGLSLVKELLTLMQGTISVESQLGKGSKFTVTLPKK